jgi:photosystem II stability/assembly factor-like uncharacterized protein
MQTGMYGNYSLTDLSFINSQDGVVCGVKYMARTIDGGKTWTELDVGTSQGFLSTSMLNQQEFLVSRNGLYKTNNAGASFHSICDYLAIKDFHFFNSDIGIIINSKIHKTINGGQTWELKFDSLPFMHACQFLTDKVGYARGGATFDATSYGQIVKTIDGGETWNVVYSSTSSEPLSMSFVNSYVGYFITIDKIYKTVDGGLSWHLIGALPNTHHYVYFISPTEGYISSMTGDLLLTRDSGEHWELVYTAPSQNQDFIIKMQRINNVIYAIGTSGLFIKSK